MPASKINILSSQDYHMTYLVNNSLINRGTLTNSGGRFPIQK